jgi:hypothetical protein
VVLADPGGHVAILPEHFADGAATPRHHTRVTVVTRRGLADRAERGRVVVAARDKGGPRWAAQRCRVKAVVTQPLVGEPLNGW